MWLAFTICTIWTYRNNINGVGQKEAKYFGRKLVRFGFEFIWFGESIDRDGIYSKSKIEVSFTILDYEFCLSIVYTAGINICSKSEMIREMMMQLLLNISMNMSPLSIYHPLIQRYCDNISFR